MNSDDLRNFLEEKYQQYHQPQFIETDPIKIPHLFINKEDIEISAFLTATIAWGQRKSILNNAHQLVKAMDMQPFEFIMNANTKEIERLRFFKHRTFCFEDLEFFIFSLRNIYQNEGGLERAFSKFLLVKDNIIYFRNIFFSISYPLRTLKHVSNPEKGASAKRLNMFLRWMVRSNKQKVDFGIWKNLSAANLMCPLDIHSGNVARKLGLLKRTQNDWQAVEELTTALLKFDAQDPVKYDFALFGLGVFEGF